MPAHFAPLVLSYKGLDPDPELLGWIQHGHVGGIVLFRDNCTDESRLAAAIKAVRTASPRPLFVMIDEEGGRVRRLPDAPDSMPDLRSYSEDELGGLADSYSRVAQRLVRLGIDTLLAPVVDIGQPDAAWLNSRTIADDPDRVAAMARAVVPAIQSLRVHACAKHFPGTGRVQLDPHLGPATCSVTEDEWRAHEMLPFASVIAAEVNMVLVGHHVMTGFGDARPSCLSPRIVSELLRERLGFRGLVLTDDLAMGAIAKSLPIEDAVGAALSAGCDLILICNDRAFQRRAIASVKGGHL